MDRLKRSRKPLRSAITRTVNAVNAEIAKEVPDNIQLGILLERINTVTAEIEEIDQKIKDMLLDENADEAVDNEEENDNAENNAGADDLYEIESAEIQEYRDKANGVRLKIKRVLEPPIVPIVQSPPISEFGTAASEYGTKRQYQLPKIQIRKFNGDIKEWLSFWAQFKKIHEDEELHDSDKFQYLSQHIVVGTRAKDLVDRYPQTAENYPKVISALKDRFAKPKVLTQVYVRELLKMVISNNTSPQSMKISQMYDKLESHLRALESLGVTTEQMALFLYPMVESSLPEEMLIAWQRSPLNGVDGSRNNPPKTELDFLMDFLRREVENEDQRHLVQTGFADLSIKESPNTKKVNAPNKKEKQSYSSRVKEEEVPTAAGLLSNTELTCIFCTKPHLSQECYKAQSMSLKEKIEHLTKQKVCHICFRSGHFAKDCKFKPKCIVCSNRHHTIMCPQLFSEKSKEVTSSSKSTEEVKTAMTNHMISDEVILQTQLVRLYSEDWKRYIVARLIHDNGSQGTGVRKYSAKKLNLTPLKKVFSRKVLYGGALTASVEHNKYKLKISSLDGSNRMELFALDEEEICGRIQRIPQGPWLKELEKMNIKLNDFKSENPEIEILVGSDYYGQLITGRIVQLECGLTAIETVFGWTLSGRNPKRTDSSVAMTGMSAALLAVQPSDDLWSLEVLGIQDSAYVKSKQERELETKLHFQRTVSRKSDGRYSVKLPRIEGAPAIPDNRQIAEKMLMTTTAKLKSTGLLETYNKLFLDWEKEGFIEEVKGEALNSHYIPHHPVFKPESLTTPVRPVFNASCKYGRNPSLNDCLEKGPNLQELIPSLFRFRKKRIGCISDVRKAFQMIEVDEDDRDSLRFLWWEDLEGKEIKIYRHARVVFGVNCSPFLLGAVIELHLKNVKEEDKPTAEKILESLYVDNCVTSVDTWQEYEEFKKKSIQIMSEAKMDLREWEHTAVEESGIGSLVSRECGLETDSVSVPRQFTNVLGLKWDKFNDTLHVDIPNDVVPEKFTKRTLLSLNQKIYDPPGYLNPADLPSRGCSPTQLLNSLWWEDLEDASKYAYAVAVFIRKKIEDAQRIEWRFKPPPAPWWGGWWERLVKSIKDLLKRMLGKERLDYIQLETILCEVEAIINGRPLTYITEDPDDLIALTPSVFLQDIRKTEFPELEQLDGGSFRMREKGLRKLKEELRWRFRKEYLSQLIQRKSEKKVHTFQPGDIVLIGSDNKKRLEWPMGKIIELIPGKDGKTRVAKVKTPYGFLIRPLQRLYPMEVSSPQDIPPIPEDIQGKIVKEKISAVEEPEIITRYGRKIKKPSRM